MSSWTSIVTYTKSGDSKGCTGKALLLSEWQNIPNLSDLSITLVDIEIINVTFIDTKHRYVYRIYDEAQIANILSTISSTTDGVNDSNENNNNNNNNHMTQKYHILNAKLNALAINMKQINMNTLNKQINDLSLIITDKTTQQNANNTLEDMRKEMHGIHENQYK